MISKVLYKGKAQIISTEWVKSNTIKKHWKGHIGVARVKIDGIGIAKCLYVPMQNKFTIPDEVNVIITKHGGQQWLNAEAKEISKLAFSDKKPVLNVEE